MTRRLSSIVTCVCALVALSVCFVVTANRVVAQNVLAQPVRSSEPVHVANWDGAVQQPVVAGPMVGYETWGAPPVTPQAATYPTAPMMPMAAPVEEQWIATPEGVSPYGVADVHVDAPSWGQPIIAESCPPDVWYWQVLPDGLIYHSYWAGVHEPRLAIIALDESGSQAFWDGTLGARVGLLRYGTGQAIFPQGWQLDVEAAAIIRMTLDEIRDFEFADYRVGIPLTYGIDNWQFKFAVYHLSSHLGDEFAIANPGSLADRINYVRDAVVLGASYYPVPVMRLYSEAAYAINIDGGAKPWEFQFGTELSRPGPTGPRGTPFFAVNAHLREEHDFGGDINTQAGWLWRGQSGQVVRAGVQYYNGKSSQYQIFDNSEEQIGFGLWYDF